MIDKVLSLDKNKIVAIKNVTANEPFFKGHFAGFPIMPGALIIEGVGQAATLLLRYNLEEHHTKDVLAFRIKRCSVAENLGIYSGASFAAVLQFLQNNNTGALSHNNSISPLIKRAINLFLSRP